MEKRSVSKEEVIGKMKDDGDFDHLRLRIIRKLKLNEQLRNNIISVVRQSAAINRPGAETLKPRQLSDAIYDEVGNQVMRQISDGLWEIIRSESDNGMKREIKDTVQSVYDKLTEAQREAEGESSSHDKIKIQNEADNKDNIKDSVNAVNDNLSDSEPKEPPGFSLCKNCQNIDNKHKKLRLPVHSEGFSEEHKVWTKHSQDVMKDDLDLGVPLGFSANTGQKHPCEDSDDDPEIPPGFG